jgi:hypothetical protein
MLKQKFNSDDTLQRNKARLVARGFAQRQNVDFFQPFTPVAKPHSAIRTTPWGHSKIGLRIE